MSLLFEEWDCWIFLVPKSSFKIMRHHLSIKLSKKREWSMIIYLWRSFLTNILIDHAWNHSYFSSVLRRSTSFHSKCNWCQRRQVLSVQIIKSNFNILWIIDNDLLIAPCFLLILNHFNWILYRHPAWSSDFSFENERLKNALIWSEYAFESVSLDGTG